MLIGPLQLFCLVLIIFFRMGNNLKIIISVCFEYMYIINMCKSSMKDIQYRSNVSWQSRLDSRSSKFSRIEFRGSSFEFQFSRFKNQFRGSSFKFRDTRRIFRGSRTEILRKRFNSQKQNNSDEQSNWHAALFAQINPLLNVCKYFFVFCIFYTTHAVRLSTLKLMTANYSTAQN